jgi:phospholipid transport system substrate-binding protein
MIQRTFAALLGATLFLLLPVQARADESKVDPTDIVQKTISDVLAVLGNAQMPEAEKKAKVSELAKSRMNFEGMTQRVLALSWKDASDAQRKRMLQLFPRIVLETYWRRARNYAGEKVEYSTGIIENDRFATIDTVITSKELEIPVTYQMELVNGKWLAYDVMVESLSMVTSYRTDYQEVIKTKGIDGLIEHMERQILKAQEEAAKSAAAAAPAPAAKPAAQPAAKPTEKK